MANPVLSPMLYAFGATLQDVGGRPTMALAQDALEGATTIYPSSALGLPAGEGWIWLGGVEMRYVALALDGDFPMTLDVPLPRNFPRGTPIVSSTRRILPAAYELFWPKSPRFKDHYQTW